MTQERREPMNFFVAFLFWQQNRDSLKLHSGKGFDQLDCQLSSIAELLPDGN